MPLAVFADDQKQNFRGLARKDVVPFLVRAKSRERLECDAEDGATRRRHLTRYVGARGAGAAEAALGGAATGLDAESGLSMSDLRLLRRGVTRGLVDACYLDFDRTITVVEGVPAPSDARCYRDLRALARAGAVRGREAPVELLLATFCGGKARVAALRKLFDACGATGCAVHVLTRNRCLSLIRAFLKALSPNLRATVRGADDLLTKPRLISKDRGRSARPTEPEAAYARELQQQSIRRLAVRPDALKGCPRLKRRRRDASSK